MERVFFLSFWVERSGAGIRSDGGADLDGALSVGLARDFPESRVGKEGWWGPPSSREQRSELASQIVFGTMY
jgi:hypothetical protein